MMAKQAMMIQAFAGLSLGIKLLCVVQEFQL